MEALHLGQAGVRIASGGTTVYIDPYLTDSVRETYGERLARLTPSPVAPDAVADADWVLITHAHLDHCDPASIVPISAASPHCRFMGPAEVREILLASGIASDRICASTERWMEIGSGFRVHAVPAAHPEVERTNAGESRFVGYVIEAGGHRVYHAGDTSPHDEVFSAVERLRPIDIAMLPVNEPNYFRARDGIIGNMTVREAFLMAERLGVRELVPIHWDLFEPNSVYWEEIELLYRLIAPSFKLMQHLRAE